LQDSIRLLGLGESNHGSHEFTRERAQLAIALARQKSFTLVLIEAGYGEALALDAYIKGADISLDAALGRLGYWMWNTTTFRDALGEIRSYNQTAPLERKITICGVDVQRTEGVLDDLSTSDVRPSNHDRELLERLRDRQGARWMEFSPEDRSSVRRLLTEIAAARDSGKLDSIKNRHALSARALLLSLDLLEQQGFWNQSRVRDKAMADLTQEILEVDPTAQGNALVAFDPHRTPVRHWCADFW
jgi:erythromycin esterase